MTTPESWACLICIHQLHVRGSALPQEEFFWREAATVVCKILHKLDLVDEQFCAVLLELMKSAKFREYIDSDVIPSMLKGLDARTSSTSVRFWIARSFLAFGIGKGTGTLFWKDVQDRGVLDTLLELMVDPDEDLAVGAVSSRTLQHFAGLRSTQQASEASKRCRASILNVLEKDKYDNIKKMLNECSKPNAKDLGQALKDIGAPSDYLRSLDGRVSRAFNATWLIQQLAECADTMKSLFHNGVFKIVIEMARSSDATFQKRGCQLLGTASRHEHDWPEFKPPQGVNDLLGSNALKNLVELIKTDDVYEQRHEYWFPETMYTTIENASCAAMFVAQLCKVTAGAILNELHDVGIVGALLSQMKSSDPETAHYCGKALGSIIMTGNGDENPIKQQVVNLQPRLPPNILKSLGVTSLDADQLKAADKLNSVVNELDTNTQLKIETETDTSLGVF
ncbi:armadillo-type protein [Mycena galopus ATCC 62051]|nr:armadillo-type protein [Mycena galopus ATCC 62051]